MSTYVWNPLIGNKGALCVVLILLNNCYVCPSQSLETSLITANWWLRWYSMVPTCACRYNDLLLTYVISSYLHSRCYVNCSTYVCSATWDLEQIFFIAKLTRNGFLLNTFAISTHVCRCHGNVFVSTFTFVVVMAMCATCLHLRLLSLWQCALVSTYVCSWHGNERCFHLGLLLLWQCAMCLHLRLSLTWQYAMFLRRFAVAVAMCDVSPLTFVVDNVRCVFT